MITFVYVLAMVVAAAGTGAGIVTEVTELWTCGGVLFMAASAKAVHGASRTLCDDEDIRLKEPALAGSEHVLLIVRFFI